MDVGGRLFASLHLHSVNLPGGELRRKSIEDELLMSQYLIDGDLVSAEVLSSIPLMNRISGFDEYNSLSNGRTSAHEFD